MKLVTYTKSHTSSNGQPKCSGRRWRWRSSLTVIPFPLNLQIFFCLFENERVINVDFPFYVERYYFHIRAGRFSVVPADKNVQTVSTAAALMPKKLWLIVKELPSGNHQLQEADVIKLGRFKLRVKQLVKSGTTLPVSSSVMSMLFIFVS